jgi:hypothetical protein
LFRGPPFNRVGVRLRNRDVAAPWIVLLRGGGRGPRNKSEDDGGKVQMRGEWASIPGVSSTNSGDFNALNFLDPI